MSGTVIPRPVIGGSYVHCPCRYYETLPGWTACRWRRRLRSSRAFRAYRHHWTRRHL